MTPTIHDITALTLALAVPSRSTARPGGNLIVPSLIDQLRSSIGSSIGSTGKGRSSGSRVPFDVAALDMYDYIVGRVEALYSAGTGLDPSGSPEEMLIRWLAVVAAENAIDELTTDQLVTLEARLDDIRTRIRDYFEPPERGEITERCPECGWRHVTRAGADGEPTRQASLVILIRPWLDNEVSITCRSCRTTWTGEDSIRELAADLNKTTLDQYIRRQDASR